jgi:hypothetical protein
MKISTAVQAPAHAMTMQEMVTSSAGHQTRTQLDTASLDGETPRMATNIARRPTGPPG